MRKRLPRRLAAIATSIALAAGALQLTTVPAYAASFKVSVKASATKVVVGKKATFTGKVSPKPSSRTLYLQRRYVGSSTWKNIKKFRAAKSGSFKVTTGFGNDTDRYYRIYKPKQGSRKAGYSKAVQVIVDPKGSVAKPPSGTIKPTTGPLSGGQRATISGTGLTGTTKVTFTPQVSPARTKDNSGMLPEVAATALKVVDDRTVEFTTPASLGGENLVKVYTPNGTLTTKYSYVATAREPSGFEQQVLDELNARRSEAQTCSGKAMPAVAAISWDGRLGDVALSHSKDQATRRSLYPTLTHDTYGTKQFRDRLDLAGVSAPFGEILALSPASYSAKSVVDQWMGSKSGHCESVMNKSWKKAGVGVASGLWGSQQSIWSNVDFQ